MFSRCAASSTNSRKPDALDSAFDDEAAADEHEGLYRCVRCVRDAIGAAGVRRSCTIGSAEADALGKQGAQFTERLPNSLVY